jgi:hypothetical protein
MMGSDRMCKLAIVSRQVASNLLPFLQAITARVK